MCKPDESIQSFVAHFLCDEIGPLTESLVDQCNPRCKFDHAALQVVLQMPWWEKARVVFHQRIQLGLSQFRVVAHEFWVSSGCVLVSVALIDAILNAR
jgi:hypothetical protein